MPKSDQALTVTPASGSPYRLDPDQTLRAATALLKAIERSQKDIAQDKPSLLADHDDEDQNGAGAQIPIWLVLTAKKHIVDSNRLKPGKIAVPHPLWTSNQIRICLITADPPSADPKAYKHLIQHRTFPEDLKPRIAKVVAFSRLQSKYKSFESRRRLLAEYDIFLADDRIVNRLPEKLGKTFYKNTTKRPVPVSLTGKERHHGKGREGEAGKLKRKRDKEAGGSTTIGQPFDVGEDIEKALHTTLVHLAPSTTTSVRAAWAGWPAEWVAENVQTIVEGMVTKYIPKGWRGVKSVHVKGPTTTALPIWLADELWIGNDHVLNQEQASVEDGFNKPMKRRASQVVASAAPSVAVKRERDDQTGAGGEQHARKKTKVKSEKDSEAAARKERLKQQKAEARREAEKMTTTTQSPKSEKGSTANDVASKKNAIDGKSKAQFSVENWSWAGRE